MLSGFRVQGFNLFRVVPKLEKLGGECARDAGRYGELKEIERALNREIETRFWAPFGRAMVRRQLRETAEQKTTRKAAERQATATASAANPGIGGSEHRAPSAAGDALADPQV